MSDVVNDYYEALKRLKRGKPVNVPKGTRITNDSVALEAGRKKGSIKKSRPIFTELIKDIADVASVERKPRDEIELRLQEARTEIARLRVLWEESLAQEVSLVKQLWDERAAWAKERATYQASKVTPFKKSK